MQSELPNWLKTATAVAATAVMVGSTGWGATDLRVSGNGHYIETTNGIPLLYVGDTEWTLKSHSDAQILQILDDRKARGFTVIMEGCPNASGWQRCEDYNDNLPLVGGNINTPNSAYWARIGWIIDRAAERGLHYRLVFWPDDMGTVYRPAQDCYEFGRKIGSYFKDKTNVIFCTGFDCAGTSGPGVVGWRAASEGIADGVNGVNSYDFSADTTTVFQTYHPSGNPPYTSSTWFHSDAWLDVNGIELWHDYGQVYGTVNADYHKTGPVKPTLLLEGSYETDGVEYPEDINGVYIDAGYVRVEAWHAFFAGGAGYEYGHVHGYCQYASVDYLGSTGAQHMGVLIEFLKAREWWKFVPDQGIIASGVGSGATRKAAVRSTDGDECYVYYPGIAAASIKMDRITSGSGVAAVWLDPRSGETEAAGTYSTSEAVSLTPPGTWEDAVLCLNAADTNHVETPGLLRNGSFEAGEEYWSFSSSDANPAHYAVDGGEGSSDGTNALMLGGGNSGVLFI